VRKTATPLLLRPREFLANAWDLVTLKAAVAEQALCYARIRCRSRSLRATSTRRSRPTFIRARSPSTKLIVLPGVGHMVQHAVPDLVVAEIEAMIARMVPSTATAN
jgi:pimeloyl-ACP methyl ester carboxylesterase